ncbi:MAG: hypothetical protein QN229_01845 [Desulfurococcaceae archaeon TW002]
MNTSRNKLLALVLLVAIGASVIPAFSTIVNAQIPQTIGETRRGSEHAVEVLISRVELLISRIRSFVEAYNIFLDDNMTSLIEEVENLVNEAKELKNTNLTEALSKVLQASRLVIPVYVYVIQNLPPTVKDDFAVRRTEAQFRVRERILLSLNATIEWLINRGVEVPEWILSNISRAFELIEEGKQALAEGNVTIAKEIIKEINTIIKNVNKALRIELRAKWVIVVCTEKVLVSLVGQVNALIHIVNESAEAIEASDYENAIEHFNAASRKAEVILVLIERLRPYVSDNTTYSQILDLSEEIATILKNSVDDARTALENNDPDTALLILSNALEEVQPLFEQLKSLAKWKLSELEEVKEMIWRIRERVRERVRRMIGTYIASSTKLELRIRILGESLIILNTLYNRGRIPCQTYLNILEAMKAFVEELLDAVPQTMYMLRARLNNLLNDINTYLSNTTC